MLNGKFSNLENVLFRKFFLGKISILENLPRKIFHFGKFSTENFPKWKIFRKTSMFSKVENFPLWKIFRKTLFMENYRTLISSNASVYMKEVHLEEDKYYDNGRMTVVMKE